MFGVALTLLGFSFFSSLTVQASICQLPTTPTITIPITNITTTDSNYVINGHSDENTTVAVYDNYQWVGTVTPDSTNSFEIEVPITVGINVFKVKATNACSTGISSSSVTITRPAVRTIVAVQPIVTPVPSITSIIPTTGAITNEVTSTPVEVASPMATPTDIKKFSITITGVNKVQSTSASSVFIAGSTTLSSNVMVEDNGVNIGSLNQFAFSTEFGFTIPLKNGNNVITISAKNGASETHETIVVKKTVQSWYQDPSTQKVVVLSALFIIIVTGSMIFL